MLSLIAMTVLLPPMGLRNVMVNYLQVELINSDAAIIVFCTVL